MIFGIPGHHVTAINQKEKGRCKQKLEKLRKFFLKATNIHFFLKYLIFKSLMIFYYFELAKPCLLSPSLMQFAWVFYGQVLALKSF